MKRPSRLETWLTGEPLDLALFRVTVSLVVLLSEDLWDARRWVGAAVRAPTGWAWAPWPSELAARVLTVVVVAATLATLVGLHTRVASAVSALGLAWLLGVPQLSGQVLHTHHLVWLSALVAAGPSGDALSWDARYKPPAKASVAHGLPLRAAWLTIGLLFFFPGLWKALEGRAWLEGLPALVAWKRFQLGLPALHLPSGLLALGGVATIGFELSVGVLLLFRRTRPIAAVLALLFHLGVQVVLGIGFSSLWACYPVFGDWARWLGRSTTPEPGWRRALPSLVVATPLLLAMVLTGALGLEQAWPVACYPRFVQPAPSRVDWVEIVELDDTGAGTQVFGLPQLRAHQRWWGLASQAARTGTNEAFRRLHRQWRPAGPLPPARYEIRSRDLREE